MTRPRKSAARSVSRMWQAPGFEHFACTMKSWRESYPVAVVDCRPEAREALEALIAKAIARSEGERRGYKINAQCYLEASRAALTALLGKMAK